MACHEIRRAHFTWSRGWEKFPPRESLSCGPGISYEIPSHPTERQIVGVLPSTASLRSWLRGWDSPAGRGFLTKSLLIPPNAKSLAFSPPLRHFVPGCGGGIRTHDLLVMSQTSCQTALPRYIFKSQFPSTKFRQSSFGNWILLFGLSAPLARHVGDPRFELGTSSLSVTRSNQLS